MKSCPARPDPWEGKRLCLVGCSTGERPGLPELGWAGLYVWERAMVRGEGRELQEVPLLCCWLSRTLG